MAEYIERSALLKYWLGRDGRRFPLHDCDNFPTTVHLADVQQSIRNAPAADVEPVRHGQWLSVCGCIVRCDLCKNEAARESNYCPNCGAKMDKEAGT
jgi:hypothetical protein